MKMCILFLSAKGIDYLIENTRNGDEFVSVIMHYGPAKTNSGQIPLKYPFQRYKQDISRKMVSVQDNGIILRHFNSKKVL